MLTGSLQNYSREAATNLIQIRGGIVTSSVSKHTDFVVVGENSGSKFEKAKALSIKILNEEEFTKML